MCSSLCGCVSLCVFLSVSLCVFLPACVFLCVCFSVCVSLCVFLSVSLCVSQCSSLCVCVRARPTLLLRGRVKVPVAGALVHGQCGRLPVGLPTVAAAVGLAVCVHHVVFVQAGVLRETLPTVGDRAQVRLLSWRGEGGGGTGVKIGRAHV